MKAAVIEHVGDLGSLKEIPEPVPAAHEILVRVTAAGVNPMDWKVRDRGGEPMPFVLGQDFAGVVSKLGANVAQYKEGERIFGVSPDRGAYAEYTVVSENDPIAKIPDDVGDADAAALPTAGLTALAGLDALQVGKGTTVLILGATGGVGSFAVQIAADRGAHVIGTARAANESLARSLGVSEFVAYDTDDVVAKVKASHPDGIDAVLDLVDSADKIKAMADVVHRGGRIVSTIGATDVAWFKQHEIVAQNIRVGNAPQWSHAGLRMLLELLQQGRIRVMISAEFPLSDAVRALDESKAGSVDGKIVLTVD